MGIFKKLKGMVGSVSSELMENGLLARGQILGVEQTNVSTGSETNPTLVCVFTVQVALDGVPPYEATCRQGFSMMTLSQLAGGAIVAVRVNPDDHSEIALDVATAPPVVALAAQPGQQTAADILAQGSPARAVIVQSQPLGMTNAAGLDLYGFQLTMIADGKAPYQIEVGNPVTPGGVPLIFPGSNVPAKFMPDGAPEDVAIDWDGTVAEMTKK